MQGRLFPPFFLRGLWQPIFLSKRNRSASITFGAICVQQVYVGATFQVEAHSFAW